MEKSELKFKVGDILEHVLSGEKCVVSRIVPQEVKPDEDSEAVTEYFYTLSPGLENSHMYPAETAHGALKLTKEVHVAEKLATADGFGTPDGGKAK